MPALTEKSMTRATAFDLPPTVGSELSSSKGEMTIAARGRLRIKRRWDFQYVNFIVDALVAGVERSGIKLLVQSEAIYQELVDDLSRVLVTSKELQREQGVTGTLQCKIVAAIRTENDLILVKMQTGDSGGS